MTSFVMNGQSLELVKSVKYLGVFLDTKLSCWKDYLHKVALLRVLLGDDTGSYIKGLFLALYILL